MASYQQDHPPPAPSAPLSNQRPMTYHSDYNRHNPYNPPSLPGSSHTQYNFAAPPPPPPPIPSNGYWNQAQPGVGPSRHSMGPGVISESLPSYVPGGHRFLGHPDAKYHTPLPPPTPNLRPTDHYDPQGQWRHHEQPPIHHRHTLATVPSAVPPPPPPLPHKEFTMPNIHQNGFDFSSAPPPPPPPLPPKILMPTPDVPENPFSDPRSMSRAHSPYGEEDGYFESHSVATSPRSNSEQLPNGVPEEHSNEEDPEMDELQKVLQLSAQSYNREQQRQQEMSSEDAELARIMELSIREEEQAQKLRQFQQELFSKVVEEDNDARNRPGPSSSHITTSGSTNGVSSNNGDDGWEAYDPAAFDNPCRPPLFESHSAPAAVPQQPNVQDNITTFAPIPRHHQTAPSLLKTEFAAMNGNLSPTSTRSTESSSPSLSRSQSYQPTGSNRNSAGLSHSRTFSGARNDMRRSIEVNQDRVQTPHLPPPPSILSSPVDEELPPPTYETVTANPIAGANSPSVTLAPPSPRMPHQHPVVPRIQTPSLVPAPNTTPPSTVPESSRADPTSPGGGVGGFVLRGFPPSSSPAGAGLSPVISPMMNPGGHAGLSPRMKPTSNLPESPGAGPSGSGSGSQQHPPPPSQPDTSPGGNTIFLDSSYMENVSFGHFAPELTQHLLPTPSGFPSKIVLHPEQAYHIRAPSWKGLLRLLAALGDTTLEPSPEAFDKIQIPSHQTSLNLRIILHFHKNKYGPDWTVIVWLDLDRGLPNIETYKYTRGDTTMLPFNHRVPEWTLGNAGQLAINSTGDITSSMTSIFYVLPNPFAGLPMPVSNLAAVLTTALMDSKKAMHLPTSNNGAGSNAASPFDPIASQRRLYKAVEKCFPQGKKGKVTAGVIEGKEEEVKIVGKKGGMTRWMSNVVGVVTRPKEVKGGQHGNDDTYVELITPYTLT